MSGPSPALLAVDRAIDQVRGRGRQLAMIHQLARRLERRHAQILRAEDLTLAQRAALAAIGAHGARRLRGGWRAGEALLRTTTIEALLNRDLIRITQRAPRRVEARLTEKGLAKLREGDCG